ncbi:MAG: hypothetical protein KF819_33285 [Labilithrix sp.]|nr:hypothetical protein [Labilithrix sp.]
MSARFGVLGALFVAASGGACGSSSSPIEPLEPGDGGTSPDAAAHDAGDAGPFHPLDMNDVTILAPLPARLGAPVLVKGTDAADDGMPFVPRALFDRVVAGSSATFDQAILPPDVHAELELVAVRFDLCDRPAPGVCPAADDGRLRLVFQPIVEASRGVIAPDVGFHAFYTIANTEIPVAVASLRDLAKSTTMARGGALRVSPALAAPASPEREAYATKLRAFVKRYGGESRIVRLTVNAQPIVFSQIRWAFRGVEKKSGAFVDMKIFGSDATDESVILNGDPAYEVTPATDAPPGLAGALSKAAFDGATDAQKRAYLAALAAIDNPMTHSAETVACVGCHASTVIMHARASGMFLDPLSVPGRYTSKWDLSIAGGESRDAAQTLRALGYLGTTPMISQRVVNDTAQVLAEIEARYPPP